jgi:hypothetical protein
MNKLCCEIHTHGKCLGCGKKWCEPCAESYSWNPNTMPHSAFEIEPNMPALWHCPAAGAVKFGPIENIYGGWVFVPLDK